MEIKCPRCDAKSAFLEGEGYLSSQAPDFQHHHDLSISHRQDVKAYWEIRPVVTVPFVQSRKLSVRFIPQQR